MTVFDAARFIWEHLQRRRGVFLAVAVLVVFVTTYLLILPAITLDKEKAAEQGGIDVPATEQTLEDSEPGDKGDPADADAAKAGQGDVDPSEDSAPAEMADEEDAEKADPYFDGALKFKGDGLKVTVSAEEDACIPSDAELAVSEIKKESNDYQALASETADVLGAGEEQIKAAKFLDISIVHEGEEIQPEAQVEVHIKMLEDEIPDDVQIVHFGENIEIIEDATVEDNVIRFETKGFSAYAIVPGPSVEGVGWKKITTLDEFKALASEGIYVGHSDGFYFTNQQYNVNSSRTGIKKTKPESSTPPDAAAPYYFELVNGTDNQFYAYCYVNGQKKYVHHTEKSLSLTPEEQKTAFTITVGNNGACTVYDNGFYWNQQGNAAGNGFAAWNENNTGSKLNFWHHTDVTSDPYNLDGKEYGLINWNGGAAGKAMMAENSGSNKLSAKPLTVMKKSDNDSDKLFVPNDSDISMWKFHWADEDQYYIETVDTDGSTKYLKINADGLSLVSSQEDASKIQVIPGSGSHAGEICLRSGAATLSYTGDINTGFGVGGSAGSEWLRFAELSELTSDYVMTHSANKVSVSDTERVGDGSKIIIYTRSWNPDTKRYDLYAIDHDGSLVPCFESGDSIQWTGGILNTLLWEFKENKDKNGNLTGYYGFYNPYSGQYIAPQVTGGQILSESPLDLNLNGRQSGKYYTPILAWDDDNYAYAGLSVDTDAGTVLSCQKTQAMDFYFAIMEEIPADDVLHTVPTVDNNEHGITMKMVDLENNKDISGEMNSFLGSSAGGAGTMLQQGLLSNKLGDDGYPVVTKDGGQSLSVLYGMHSTDPKRKLREVNHLFIESIYESTGYYEFDSTQNFASLERDSNGNITGDFRVYKELGSYDSGGNKNTLKHGQFFPYDDIEPGVFAKDNPKNLYSATAQLLPNSDPRKNEQLYLISNDKVDPYYAMELEASFVQTPSGKDAWGHDIIYEFTGDDDFWLYVDGELVIDLGGIHSAVAGSVNFRTGQVNVNGTDTSLYDIFKANREARGEPTDNLGNIFERNEDGQYVFKDNTTHTMRIFYMERGASASNLHMRFNLASIKPGTVQLSKKLSGVDDSETVLAEFPYQIIYKHDEDTDYLKNKTDANGQEVNYVFYKDTVIPVKFKDQIEIDGKTYENVFMLKPDEVAEITFPTFEPDDPNVLDPEHIDLYSIIECGVNTELYDYVSITTEDTTERVKGTDVEGSTNRKDFETGFAPIYGQNKRNSVKYTNSVDPDALRKLTIKKKLYDETGTNELHNEDAVFDFRLFLAGELDEGDILQNPANMYSYHVKNESGEYCRWDSANKKFVTTGVTDYSTFTHEEKEAATFHTSINGAISKIPAYYTVEINSILAGTQYRVEERPWEIPDGYSFQKYIEDDNAYIVEREEKDKDGYKGKLIPGVNDTIRAGSDSNVDVCNLKGWGLRMYKQWSDQDYMSDRAPTYFAVYIKRNDNHGQGNGNGSIDLVEGTVRQLKYTDDPQTLYWYFNSLEQGTNFDHYIVREVELKDDDGWTVKEDGTVTGINPHHVKPLHEKSKIALSGKQKGETDSGRFEYTVSYQKGEVPSGSNVRVDTVTNSRPGIVLKKTDWTGHPLPDASFTLMKAETKIGDFTSDSEGQITVAFLSKDEDYTLTETKSPDGYHGLQDPLTIRWSSDGERVQVTGADANYYSLVQNDGETPVLTIKNRPYTFQAIKIDGSTEEPMAGVKFQLHKQHTVDGVTSFDTNPMPGFSELVTDEDGVIPQLDVTLPAGTYQLREKEVPVNYQALSKHTEFTVSKTGAISLVNNHYAEGVELTSDETAQDGTLKYELTIPNYLNGEVTLHKVDAGGQNLNGAKFSLCRHTDSWEVVQEVVDMSDVSSITIDQLPTGIYRLEETEAPAGYIIENKYTYFQIAEDRTISLTDEAGTGGNANDDATINETTITITNHAGAELPSSGGPGTTWIYLLGAVLLIGCSITLIARRRSRVE